MGNGADQLMSSPRSWSRSRKIDLAGHELGESDPWKIQRLIQARVRYACQAMKNRVVDVEEHLGPMK